MLVPHPAGQPLPLWGHPSAKTHLILFFQQGRKTPLSPAVQRPQLGAPRWKKKATRTTLDLQGVSNGGPLVVGWGFQPGHPLEGTWTENDRGG